MPIDISRQDGTIHLPNGFMIDAGLTKDAFRASPIFDALKRQDGGAPGWIQYHIFGGAIDGRDCTVSLSFYNQMLISVSLMADLYPPGPKSWDTYSLETEAATKDFHDRLLEYLFAGPAKGDSFHL